MPKSASVAVVAAISAVVASIIWWYTQTRSPETWTSAEITLLRSLWIADLPTLPTNTGNAAADSLEVAQLGHQLFFDKRLSTREQVSCASCHQPERHFTDGLEVAVGAKTGVRNTMSIVGTAYSPWFFWDGRKDSLWSQALSPLESPLEHGSTRMQLVHLVTQDSGYRMQYEKLFGPLAKFSDPLRFPAAAGPIDDDTLSSNWHSMSTEDREAVTRVFVNIGKSIAAYERLLVPGSSRFDQYVEALVADNNAKTDMLSPDELAGLKLFIGEAQCINCHNGPLFTNHEFHNTGVLSSPGTLPSMGRAEGLRELLKDPFNCMGQFSDSEIAECEELRFVRTGDELIGTHKTPSLRNVAETAPYMHAGQLATLTEVINHYDRAPGAMVGHNEAKTLDLGRREKRQLEAFLHTLTGPVEADSKWLVAPGN
ncbi:MAG: cytochrome-c peroxidase [Gammaproteobacteria bacterium]|nr:cytochrome-c peroxidase [Gammaproteobacteria bacterium]